LHSLRYVKINF